ncbi:hypothetical protein D0U04_16155 [Bacillus clarus]|uniref:Uncharacterized protein n=1 Tax=Bacillus clarus TaxID=2338372 RepID=A0ABX9KTS7_9BACI|nr:hypothetical protein D0U04_16155 [Bacillus clarus]
MLHSSGIRGGVFSTSSKFTVYFLQKLLYNDYRSYLFKVIVVCYKLLISCCLHERRFFILL